MRYVVVVEFGVQPWIYGPFDDQATAERFARFMTAEVDPAEVRELRSPTAELLSWRKVQQAR